MLPCIAGSYKQQSFGVYPLKQECLHKGNTQSVSLNVGMPKEARLDAALAAGLATSSLFAAGWS